MSAATLLQTSFSDLKLVRRGKVRDVYAVDDNSLLIVAIGAVLLMTLAATVLPGIRASRVDPLVALRAE